jgi:hypothetical protein
MRVSTSILFFLFLSLTGMGFAGECMAAGRIQSKPGSGKQDRWKVGMLCAKTGKCHLVKDPLAAVVKAIRAHPDLDLLVGPEWFFVPQAILHSGAEFRNICRSIQQASQGLPMLIAPGSIARRNRNGKYENTALVISNGKVLKTYSKRSAGGDSSLACLARTTWQPGNADGLLAWERNGRTYRVGIEICADHMSRRLFDETRSPTGQANPVDVHLVSACDLGRIDGGLAIGPGGLFVLNDGSKPKSDVRRFDREKQPSKGSLAGADPYWGWKSSQIAWNEGRAGRPKQLTEDTALVIYSIPAPR